MVLVKEANNFLIIVTAVLFLTGGILGGLIRRRLKKGISLKRQQNAFFLKQKAVALSVPASAQDLSAPPSAESRKKLLEDLWQARLLPESDRVNYLKIFVEDKKDQSEESLIPKQELLVLLGYAFFAFLALGLLATSGA